MHIVKVSVQEDFSAFARCQCGWVFQTTRQADAPLASQAGWAAARTHRRDAR